MSTSSVEDKVATTVAAKVRRRVMPLLAAAWFIAYIDRFNVSFAALQMNGELGLPAAAFGFGAGIFFVGYSLFEVPSNLALTRVGARRWLSRIMVSWGIVSVAMAATRGPASFYALRFLLGAAEAGCFPGMAYYLSLWLTRKERAAALGLLGSMTMVSGMVGGPVAGGLLALRGVLGLSGWQWLFVVEGVPAIVIGLCILRYLPDRPDTVAWLTSDEREWLRHHVTDERVLPTKSSLRAVASDARYWMWALAFFCATAGGSVITLFRPMILRQVTGYGDTAAATLTAIPSLVGALVIVHVGRRSTTADERRWHAAVPLFISGVALAFVGVTYGLVGALLMSSLATVGVAAQPPLFASVSSAASGSINAAGIAFVNALSALGAFVGPSLVGYAIQNFGGLPIACAAAGAIMAFGGIVAVLTREGAAVQVFNRAVSTS